MGFIPCSPRVLWEMVGTRLGQQPQLQEGTASASCSQDSKITVSPAGAKLVKLQGQLFPRGEGRGCSTHPTLGVHL